MVLGGSQPPLEDFRNRLQDIGYVFVKLTETKGGTDLDILVDTHLSGADFAGATEVVQVEGTLTLNYVKARCVADVHLATLEGKGHLVVLGEARQEV